MFSIGIKLKAEHIVSGVMEYEYLGRGAATNTNRYQITMRLYTDCSIDKTIEKSVDIGIYKGTAGNYVFVGTRRVSLGRNPINEDLSGSCAQLLSNICVGTATYIFIEDLPIASGNYIFAYQRCCRNMTISNILDPGRTGSTIMMELTPESYRAQNSSPKFEINLPIVTCINEALDLDVLGTDNEKDSIVYELCAPLVGGGPRGSGGVSGDPNDCLGITPNPQVCIPTLKEVSYSNANFTASNPFPSSSPIILSNGKLKALPNTLGQYIFGICIKEYRNGLLMTIQRRDVQINFVACNIIIKASIKNSIIENNVATVINCDPKSVFKITNSSIDSINIKKVNWEFTTPKGNKITSDSFHFVKILSDTGLYIGKMILNKGNQCRDSMQINIRVGNMATFTIPFSPIDSCNLFVKFLQSTSLPLNEKLFQWDFGDNTSQNGLYPSEHNYSKPGNYFVKLKYDNGVCPTEIVKNIRLYPAPTNPTLKITDSIICFPGNLLLGINELQDSSYTYTWSLSDNRIFKEVSPTIPINMSSNFKVKLTISSHVGCTNTKDFATIFRGKEKPKALFTSNQTNLSIKSPIIQLTNNSQNATKYVWSFGDQTESLEINPSHTYIKVGNYTITLRASNDLGCTDSSTILIKVGEVSEVFTPNIFTPNGDGANDILLPQIKISDVSQYEFQIFNRWGELVFSTKDQNTGWDGSNRKGKIVPNGVYVYQILLSSPDQATKVVKGSVTLIR